MKIYSGLIILYLFFHLQLSGTTHTITNSGFNFVPNAITINPGDTINFSLESMHNALEVNQATWNSNGTTSNGGFQVPFGGGIVVLTEVKTYYFVCVPHAGFGMKGMITVSSVTDVNESIETYPEQIVLHQNYPNPFNPSTTISFAISRSEYISLKVYNLIGQEVDNLLDKFLTAGNYSITYQPQTLPSGMYIYVLQSDGYTQRRKLVLIQ